MVHENVFKAYTDFYKLLPVKCYIILHEETNIPKIIWQVWVPYYIFRWKEDLLQQILRLEQLILRIWFSFPILVCTKKLLEAKSNLPNWILSSIFICGITLGEQRQKRWNHLIKCVKHFNYSKAQVLSGVGLSEANHFLLRGYNIMLLTFT